MDPDVEEHIEEIKLGANEREALRDYRDQHKLKLKGYAEGREIDEVDLRHILGVAHELAQGLNKEQHIREKIAQELHQIEIVREILEDEESLIQKIISLTTSAEDYLDIMQAGQERVALKHLVIIMDELVKLFTYDLDNM